MKSTLLTTTALVMLASTSAVYADGHTGISFVGNANVGFNDDDGEFGEDGFFWDADIDVTMSAALDNGVTAAVNFELDIVDDENSETISSDEFVLSVTTENAGFFFGDTEFAAETLWVSAGDMEADGFSEADGENVIRGDVSVAGFDLSLSYVVTHALGTDAGDNGVVNANFNPDGVAAGLVTATADFQDNDEFVDQLSLGIAGDIGMFSLSAAYQEESVSAGISAAAAGLTGDEITSLVAAGLYAPGVANGDFTENQIFGVSGGVSLAGADITLAYAQKTGFDGADDESSTGIQVAYPFGPVTVTAYYVSEDDNDSDEDNLGINVAFADGPISVTADYDDDQGTDKWSLEGSYDLGNGLTVLAGVLNEDEEEEDFYVAGEFDLGGGAELLVSFAEDESGDQEDEVGAPEYLPGTTVEVSFSF
ncbi:MAG: porin [Pseudomonadota bacterium]